MVYYIIEGLVDWGFGFTCRGFAPFSFQLSNREFFLLFFLLMYCILEVCKEDTTNYISFFYMFSFFIYIIRCKTFIGFVRNQGRHHHHYTLETKDKT